jgi:AcrR family transcriptional regulator
MQILKDQIRQRILAEALEVFLEKGYEKASMRDLAQRVGTSVSNIYHYFANKEDLFRAIAEPIASRVNHVLSEIITHEAQGPTELVQEEYVTREIGETIKANRREFLVLMDKSGGTGYENVRSDIISAVETHIMEHHLGDSKEARHPKGGFLMHLLATNLIEALVEIARHCDEEKEVEHSIRALMKYHVGGVARLMG